MKIIFLFFPFFLSWGLFAQIDEKQEIEQVIRKFLKAVVQKNNQEIQRLSLYHEELNILWTSPKFQQKEQLLNALDKIKFTWLKPGDQLRVLALNSTVNKYMVNEKRKIVLPKIIRFASPIQVIKINEEWKVEPYFFILNEKSKLEKNKKSGNFTHILELNGQIYNINLDKRDIITLPNGQKIALLLKETPMKKFENPLLSFSYNRLLRLKEHYYVEQEKQIISLNRPNARILIEVSPILPTKSTKKVLEDVINTYIQQYNSLGLNVLKDKTVVSLKLFDENQSFGKRIYAQLEENTTQVDQVYCFDYKGKRIFISYNCHLHELDLMNDFFSQIQESLKFKF